MGMRVNAKLEPESSLLVSHATRGGGFRHAGGVYAEPETEDDNDD